MFYGQREGKPCPLNFVMNQVSSYIKDILCIGVMLLTFNVRKKKHKTSLQFVSSEKFFGEVTRTARPREIDYEIEFIHGA